MRFPIWGLILILAVPTIAGSSDEKPATLQLMPVPAQITIGTGALEIGGSDGVALRAVAAGDVGIELASSDVLDAIDVTQRNVTGDVKMKLYKGQCTPAGIKSRTSLYQPDLASFKMGSEYDSTDATGFIRLFGLPSRVAAVVNSKKNQKGT